MEISGDPGPLLASAIVAALAQIEEEAADAASVPPGRPIPGRWVTSGLPRAVPPPFVARPARASERSVSGDEAEPG